MSGKNHAFILLSIFVFVSCNVENKRIEPALESITVNDIQNRISVLA